jgi:hypothetical protein
LHEIRYISFVICRTNRMGASKPLQPKTQREKRAEGESYRLVLVYNVMCVWLIWLYDEDGMWGERCSSNRIEG